MDNNRRTYRLTLATEDVEAFLEECEDAAWYAMDTGERVLTDEGPDAEAVLLVEPAAQVSRREAAAVAR